MKKTIFSVAFLLYHIMHAAPPSLPSSSVAFAQIAQPTTQANASIIPQNLPCFTTYDGLNNIVKTQQFSSFFIAQAQQSNTSTSSINIQFVTAQQNLITTSKNSNFTTFSN